MSAAGNRIRVLVVDDDDSIRLLVQRALERNGFEVGVAADGEEAMQKIEGGAFDLLILDLMMPRLSGFDVVKRLSAGDAGAPKILIMTAASPAVLRELPTERVGRIITKPFDLNQLVRTARDAAVSDGEKDAGAEE